jgi:hypothetical protein
VTAVHQCCFEPHCLLTHATSTCHCLQILEAEEARRDELQANLKAQLEKTQSLAAQAALYKDKVGSYSDTVATNAGLWPDLDKRCEDMRASAKTMEVIVCNVTRLR